MRLRCREKEQVHGSHDRPAEEMARVCFSLGLLKRAAGCLRFVEGDIHGNELDGVVML